MAFTNITLASNANQAFPGVASNDWIMYASSNQRLWMGTGSNALVITPSNVSASNVSIAGSLTLNGRALTNFADISTFNNAITAPSASFTTVSIAGSITLNGKTYTDLSSGSNGGSNTGTTTGTSVSSNQAFSNVYTSNITASNASFSNLNIAAVSSSRITVGNGGPLVAPTLYVAKYEISGSNGTFSNLAVSSGGTVDFSTASSVLMPPSFTANASTKSNQSFSNVYSSNITATIAAFSNVAVAAAGTVDFSAASSILMPPSFVASISVKSNQSFSNVYSSNIATTSLSASNAAFGDLTITGQVVGFKGVDSNQSFSNVYTSNMVVTGTSTFSNTATFSNINFLGTLTQNGTPFVSSTNAYSSAGSITTSNYAFSNGILCPTITFTKNPVVLPNGQVGSASMSFSNVTLSNLVVTGTVTGFTGVSSNQTFSNVSSGTGSFISLASSNLNCPNITFNRLNNFPGVATAPTTTSFPMHIEFFTGGTGTTTCFLQNTTVPADTITITQLASVKFASNFKLNWTPTFVTTANGFAQSLVIPYTGLYAVRWLAQTNGIMDLWVAKNGNAYDFSNNNVIIQNYIANAGMATGQHATVYLQSTDTLTFGFKAGSQFVGFNPFTNVNTATVTLLQRLT